MKHESTNEEPTENHLPHLHVALNTPSLKPAVSPSSFLNKSPLGPTPTSLPLVPTVLAKQ